MHFTTAAALAALASSAAAAKDERTFAVLHFNGKQLTRGRVDPIVDPGGPSDHVHTVMGGSNFGFNSTGEDLMKSSCTNAKIKGDNSNYWFPSLFFQDPKTGKFEDVELFYAQAYYFFEATNDDIKAFPVGLSMVTGDATTRDPPEYGGGGGNLDPSKGKPNGIKWTCPRKNFDPPSWPADSDGTKAGMGDPNNKGEGVGFPFSDCDGYASPLRADMHFPSCYNPEAGLTNFKENMVFPSSVGDGKSDCPKGYIHVPHLFIEAYWNTPKFVDRWEQGKDSQPFVLASGDATGYSSHADFMAAWEEPLLQQIIDNCDAGTSGMDKCPGMENHVNDEKCEIDSPVDEVTEGVLDALPNNKPVTGWGKGDGGEKKPAASPSKGVGQKPTPTKPVNGSPAGSSKEAEPTNPPTTTTSQKLGGTSSCTSPTTHTAWETVTVTGELPSTTSQPSTNSPAPVDGFKYAGCFKDSRGRVLNGEIRPNLGAVSNKNCVKHCKSAGFSVAGTEYGGQCYCGNELAGSEKLDDAECDAACEGDASSICGGSWALSVYSKDGEVSLKGSKPSRRHLHGHIRRH